MVLRRHSRGDPFAHGDRIVQLPHAVSRRRVLLLQPEPDDAEIFFTNVFRCEPPARLRARYLRTRRDLAAAPRSWSPCSRATASPSGTIALGSAPHARREPRAPWPAPRALGGPPSARRGLHDLRRWRATTELLAARDRLCRQHVAKVDGTPLGPSARARVTAPLLAQSLRLFNEQGEPTSPLAGHRRRAGHEPRTSTTTSANKDHRGGALRALRGAIDVQPGPVKGATRGDREPVALPHLMLEASGLPLPLSQPGRPAHAQRAPARSISRASSPASTRPSWACARAWSRPAPCARAPPRSALSPVTCSSVATYWLSFARLLLARASRATRSARAPTM